MATSNGTPFARPSRKLRRRFSSDCIPARNASPKRLSSSRSPVRNQGMSSLRPHGLDVYQKPYGTAIPYYETYQPLTDIGNRGRSPSPARRVLGERPALIAYASLPPTPILPSRPLSPLSPIEPDYLNDNPPHDDTPFSLWDYLREELLATDFDSHQELKWERVSNFLSMPLAMEKVWFQLFLTVPARLTFCDLDNWLWIHTLL